MQLKAMAEQLLLVNRLQAMIADPKCRLVFKPQMSKSIFKPHVSYLFYNGNDKLMFIITGEYLLMSGMQIEISNFQHKKILKLAGLRHRAERQARSIVNRENSTTSIIIQK